jgi:AcrR family transcriptional regulator
VTSATDARNRPLRADAQRNRARILEAAEMVFAEKGSGVGVDDIAAAAGVGVGTLYRHFPTKEALIEAVLIDRMNRLISDARQYLGAERPGDALFEFLSHLVDVSLAKRDLVEALGKGAHGSEPLEVAGQAMVEQLTAITTKLLGAAQAGGDVRSDVSTPDLIGLVMGPCMASDNPVTSACDPRLMLGIVWDGLRPGPPPG